MSGIDRFTCEEMFRRLDDYLDRELSEREMELAREHLETCAMCAQEHRFEASVLDEVRSLVRRIDVPTDMLERIVVSLAAERDRGGQRETS